MVNIFQKICVSPSTINIWGPELTFLLFPVLILPLPQKSEATIKLKGYTKLILKFEGFLIQVFSAQDQEGGGKRGIFT